MRGRGSTSPCGHVSPSKSSPAAGGAKAPEPPVARRCQSLSGVPGPGGPVFSCGCAEFPKPSTRVRLRVKSEGHGPVWPASWTEFSRSSPKGTGRGGAGLSRDLRNPPRDLPEALHASDQEDEATSLFRTEASRNPEPSWEEVLPGAGQGPFSATVKEHCALAGGSFSPPAPWSESGRSREPAVIPQRPLEILHLPGGLQRRLSRDSPGQAPTPVQIQFTLPKTP